MDCWQCKAKKRKMHTSETGRLGGTEPVKPLPKFTFHANLIESQETFFNCSSTMRGIPFPSCDAAVYGDNLSRTMGRWGGGFSFPTWVDSVCAIQRVLLVLCTFWSRAMFAWLRGSGSVGLAQTTENVVDAAWNLGKKRRPFPRPLRGGVTPYRLSDVA